MPGTTAPGAIVPRSVLSTVCATSIPGAHALMDGLSLHVIFPRATRGDPDMVSARTPLAPAPHAGLAMIALVPAAQLFANTECATTIFVNATLAGLVSNVPYRRAVPIAI